MERRLNPVGEACLAVRPRAKRSRIAEETRTWSAAWRVWARGSNAPRSEASQGWRCRREGVQTLCSLCEVGAWDPAHPHAGEVRPMKVRAGTRWVAVQVLN
jgi:hypothetical protein